MSDGGTAFPGFRMEPPYDPNLEDPNGMFVQQREEHPGMTLRDYFAAAATVGVLADMQFTKETPETVAENAYKIADAMLAQREVADHIVDANKKGIK